MRRGRALRPAAPISPLPIASLAVAWVATAWVAIGLAAAGAAGRGAGARHAADRARAVRRGRARRAAALISSLPIAWAAAWVAIGGAAAGAAPRAAHATAAPAAPARPNAGHADWLATITRTPSGAFVLGNPGAKVRVVEYLSYSCTHCAAFDAEGGPALRAGYIATGRVSLEVRHAIRDPFDTAAAMLARCDPARFFAISHAIFARQQTWLARAGDYTPPVPPPASDAAALAGIARFAGFDAIAAEQGLPPARQGACLASRGELDRLGAMRQEAWTTRAIGGTPAFFINGVDANTTAWAQLEPKLKAALR